ncbi:hypothetical protein ONS96_003141 [Cadophora gregata f. sp. sojae]|nr:hypothetical protein ONS96_003141 [Cadophora gregata f. sp. sojae]
MHLLTTLSTLRSYNAAYLSALSLVIIQVGIGCIMRSSQTSGKYTFSTSSSVTISEFFKFLISSALIVRSAVRARRDSPGRLELVVVSGEDGVGDEVGEKVRVGDGDGDGDEDAGAGAGVGFEDERLIPGGGVGVGVGRRRGNLVGDYVRSLGMVRVENRYGFAKLALLYALINNTIFVAYKLADPGTIALVRSGVIFITALIMVFALGADVSKVQWTAIIIQLCGLVTTQYTPETGTSYPLSTYMVLLFQVFVSSVAGVYNQSLLKSDQASLHAQNAVLYGCGVVINGLVHVTLSYVTEDEPGFFVGYNNSAAYLVIVSNVFIGLAITAVYKYANAVIKCLATAVATGILLYISPILFGTTMAPLIIPGGLIVFITSWLYMESPAPKRPASFADEHDAPRNRLFSFIPSGPKYNNPILLISTLLSITIITFCETMSLPDLTSPSDLTPDLPILTSPFNNTLAFVRWNGHRPERVPLIEKYAPFFHTLHFSMPAMVDAPLKTEYQNLTHDNWGDGLVTYVQIARTMEWILKMQRNESEREIEGLLQFHFDAWVDPMDFAEEDFNKMWIAVSRHNDGAGGGPTFLCMTKRERFSSWVGMSPNHNWQYPLLEALASLTAANTDYVFDPDEWCTGWSDIYYVPRHLWVDYIYLAYTFAAHSVFHEMAVPTILHIIDQTRRQRELSSIISFIGDCYGGCCAPGAGMEDLLSHRCGHKLDYQGRVQEAHYERLDYAASVLGTPIERPSWLSPEDQANRVNWTAFESSLSPEARKKLDEARFNTRLGKTMGHNMPENFVFNATGVEPPPSPAELRKVEQERKKKVEEERKKVEEERKRVEAEMERERKKEAERKAEVQRLKDLEGQRVKAKVEEEQAKKGSGNGNANANANANGNGNGGAAPAVANET